MAQDTVCQEELRQLKKIVLYDKMMAGIYLMALRPLAWPAFLEESLRGVGETLDVSKVYLFAHRHQTKTMDNIFEWVALGVPASKGGLQNLRTSVIPWWINTLQSEKLIRLRDIEQIPSEPEREIFRELGIKSILAIPLFVGTQYYGFLGIDERRCYRDWEELEVDSLHSVAQILTDKLERQRRERVLLEEKEQQAVRIFLSQKMEAIGMLAAGVSHEINTPIQYVGDNAHFLREALEQLMALLKQYQNLAEQVRSNCVEEGLLQEIETMEEAMDMAYLEREIPNAINQSLEGISKVSQLVSAMKEFSHPGKDRKGWADINRSIASTVKIAQNEWKYVAELELDLEKDLPLVYCHIGEINQVVLNMIINAAQTIKEKAADADSATSKGKITVRTRLLGDHVSILIEDTGKGIPNVLLDKIFNPFFTTKDLGVGTGQGLAISREIILQRHSGQINVQSVEGVGTTFTLDLPMGLLEVELDEREGGLA